MKCLTDERALIMADLHLGIEYSLAEKGAIVPSQTQATLTKITGLIHRYQADRLIILGDVKHTIPITTWLEKQELNAFFGELSTQIRALDIIPGNHDGGLEKLLSDHPTIHFHPSTGWVYRGLGLFHGHCWPERSVMEQATLLMGHNHPHILFIDAVGGQASHPCWIRTTVNTEKLEEFYPDLVPVSTPLPQELIILPASSEYGSGVAFNQPDQRYLGPVLNHGIAQFRTAGVYLLDGTNIGKLSDLVSLARMQDEIAGQKKGKKKKKKTRQLSARRS